MRKFGKYEKMRKNAILQTYITSLLCLVLCVAMFFGTSMAWFSDTAESTQNQMFVGTLAIDLNHATFKNGAIDTTKGTNGYVAVDGTHKILDESIKWEPGYTAVEKFELIENGDLAFSYQMGFEHADLANAGADKIEIAKAITVLNYTGANAAGMNALPDNFAELTALDEDEDGKSDWENIGTLYDVITKHTTVFKGEMDKNRVAEVQKDEAGNPVLVDGKEVSVPVYHVIALHMNESFDGFVKDADGKPTDTTVQGQTLDGITIKLVATQMASEEDAFGSTYDRTFVDVSTADGLKEAFANGDNVRLTSDITLEEPLLAKEGAEVYLDMNGKTITPASAKVDPLIDMEAGATLTIDGNGTFDLGENPVMSFVVPRGKLVIENGTFIRKVPAGTSANGVGGMFMGIKNADASVVINGGYFDGGYYDKNANGIDEILNGTKAFEETDTANRGQSTDKDLMRVAIKTNVTKFLNLSSNSFKIYGGTFVGANPAWGDEGCMLPTTPNYLRPWSYYQGPLLDGQTFNENGIVLPDGYTITKGTHADGRPTYTVNFSK